MIIDVHCHLFSKDYANDAFWEYEATFTGKEMGRIVGKEIDTQTVLKTLVPQWWATDGEATLKIMDKAGIDKAVLLSIDLNVFWGEGAKSVKEQNEEIAEVARKHPDRFLFCPQIDPQRPEAMELIEKCVNEWGARAIKLYPVTGFAPDDDLVYPLLEKVAAWELPLIVHIGSEPPPLKVEGAHPARLEKTLRDFPDLTVLACHFGLIWWRELLALGQKYPNLVTDFSGWQPTILGTYGRFGHVLRRFCNEIGVDRVMFGTDIPGFEHLLPTDKWVQMIKDLPRNPPPGMSFTDAEIEAILGGNAERIFLRAAKNRKNDMGKSRSGGVG